MLRFGDGRALTKHLHDDLKLPIDLEDAKVVVAAPVIDDSLVIGAPSVLPKRKARVKVRTVKTKVTVKKSRLEKATSNLYDLEDCSGPEKTLNIDFGLYQMEDY